MGTFLSVLVGAAASWLATYFYYRKASEELRDEAKELRRIVTLVLQALQHAGVVTVNWGPDGRPRGFDVTLKADPAEIRFIAPDATLVQGPPPTKEG